MEAGGAGSVTFVALPLGPIDHCLINLREGSDFLHDLHAELVLMPGKNVRTASRETRARWHEDEKAARPTTCLN